ncbi:MAG: LysM peptidoglycan-binding domain-containing protein [Chloroflexi bacterium]|nr:LysM peptidoglycan-binding domain-containing protein [Chloroflexota bacterium]
MSRRRPGLAACALALVVALVGCDLASLDPAATPFGSSPTPFGSAPTGSIDPGPPGDSPAPSTEPTVVTHDPSGGPGPLPTPEQYVVQRGDTLTAIARRFGITVAQLLAANPQVRDPNTIRFGYALTVPPRDSLAVMYRGGGGMTDPSGDVLDGGGQLTQAPGYADLVRFTARFEGPDLIVELDGISAPPLLDPEGEELRFILEIDATGDLEPDFQAVAGNALTDPAAEEGPPLGLSVLDRRSDTTIRTPNAPGTVAIVDRRLEMRLGLAGLGEPRQVAVVALVERDFFPDGRAQPQTVESSIDRVPDQQWPRANPRWLIITRVP